MGIRHPFKAGQDALQHAGKRKWLHKFPEICMMISQVGCGGYSQTKVHIHVTLESKSPGGKYDKKGYVAVQKSGE